MPKIERSADVVWEGPLARGTGHLTAGTGAFAELPYSLPTRIGAAEGRTSPEELLAAAHAGCFTMSLAGELSGAGTPPTRLEVHCVVTMDEVEGQGHQIVGSHLTVKVDAEGGEDVVDDALARADDGCPFSGLLKRAGATVTIDRG